MALTCDPSKTTPVWRRCRVGIPSYVSTLPTSLHDCCRLLSPLLLAPCPLSFLSFAVLFRGVGQNRVQLACRRGSAAAPDKYASGLCMYPCVPCVCRAARVLHFILPHSACLFTPTTLSSPAPLSTPPLYSSSPPPLYCSSRLRATTASTGWPWNHRSGGRSIAAHGGSGRSVDSSTRWSATAVRDRWSNRFSTITTWFNNLRRPRLLLLLSYDAVVVVPVVVWQHGGGTRARHL